MFKNASNIQFNRSLKAGVLFGAIAGGTALLAALAASTQVEPGAAAVRSIASSKPNSTAPYVSAAPRMVQSFRQTKFENYRDPSVAGILTFPTQPKSPEQPEDKTKRADAFGYDFPQASLGEVGGTLVDEGRFSIAKQPSWVTDRAATTKRVDSIWANPALNPMTKIFLTGTAQMGLKPQVETKKPASKKSGLAQPAR